MFSPVLADVSKENGLAAGRHLEAAGVACRTFASLVIEASRDQFILDGRGAREHNATDGGSAILGQKRGIHLLQDLLDPCRPSLQPNASNSLGALTSLLLLLLLLGACAAQLLQVAQSYPTSTSGAISCKGYTKERFKANVGQFASSQIQLQGVCRKHLAPLPDTRTTPY